MVTEDYVSFETAKLLKEKGFDRACKVWYAEYTSMWGGDPSGDRKYINIQFDNKNRFDENYKFLCYAPTLQMAMKWLRNKHNIIISIFPTIETNMIIREDYNYIIYKNKTSLYQDCSITYEQACEAAIKYCLENLI